MIKKSEVCKKIIKIVRHVYVMYNYLEKMGKNHKKINLESHIFY